MVYRKNVGALQAGLRVAAGLGLAAWGLWEFGGSTRGLALAGTGALTALTGWFGFCPACWLVGRRGAS